MEKKVNPETIKVINKKKAIFISCVSSFLEILNSQANLLYNFKGSGEISKKVARETRASPKLPFLLITCSGGMYYINEEVPKYIGIIDFVYSTQIGPSDEFSAQSGGLGILFTPNNKCDQENLGLITGLSNRNKNVFNPLAKRVNLTVT